VVYAAAVVLAVIATTVVLLRRRFVVAQVVGGSMEPVLRNGQRVLVRRAVVESVERGERVVFALASIRPQLPGESPWMLKRAVAVPGDPIPHESVPPSVDAEHTHVPEGQLVVRGDNSATSFDSRQAGFIDGGALLGVVVRTLV
jgi:signal peptidase I